jgi:hypothetical protein
MIKKILIIFVFLASGQGLANLKILPDSVHTVSRIIYTEVRDIYTFNEVIEEIELLDKNFDGLVSIEEGNGLLISEILPKVKSQDKLMTNYEKAKAQVERAKELAGLDAWLKKIEKNNPWQNSNSATTSIAECKKAKKSYNFYHKKMKRGAFTGILSSALTGHSTFDSNKHDIYEIQRDNAEGFLEVNNCSAYGIYK